MVNDYVLLNLVYSPGRDNFGEGYGIGLGFILETTRQGHYCTHE